MKACHGLRSGIDRSSSLSLVIRGIHSSFRPLDSSFVRKCAYADFERALEPLHSAISSFRPLNSSFPRRRESRGEVRVVAMTLELSHQPMHPIFTPWCAGTSRHERLL